MILFIFFCIGKITENEIWQNNFWFEEQYQASFQLWKIVGPPSLDVSLFSVFDWIQAQAMNSLVRLAFSLLAKPSLMLIHKWYLLNYRTSLSFIIKGMLNRNYYYMPGPALGRKEPMTGIEMQFAGREERNCRFWSSQLWYGTTQVW